jgi:hypothetical protein
MAPAEWAAPVPENVTDLLRSHRQTVVGFQLDLIVGPDRTTRGSGQRGASLLSRLAQKERSCEQRKKPSLTLTQAGATWPPAPVAT